MIMAEWVMSWAPSRIDRVNQIAYTIWEQGLVAMEAIVVSTIPRMQDK